MRLLRPSAIVDLNRVPGLDDIRLDDGNLRIGALARYATLERSPIVIEHLPLLARANPFVGDRQVRNRGTSSERCATPIPPARWQSSPLRSARPARWSDRRAHDAANTVEGSRRPPSAIRATGEAAAIAVDPSSDVRASAEYRRHLVPIFVERALERLITAAR